MDVGRCVSFENSLLAFMICFRPFLVHLLLKTGEHLEDLTFGWKLGLVLVLLSSQVSRRGRLTFSSVFDENIGVRRMTISGPRASISRQLSLQAELPAQEVFFFD